MSFFKLSTCLTGSCTVVKTWNCEYMSGAVYLVAMLHLADTTSFPKGLNRTRHLVVFVWHQFFPSFSLRADDLRRALPEHRSPWFSISHRTAYCHSHRFTWLGEERLCLHGFNTANEWFTPNTSFRSGIALPCATMSGRQHNDNPFPALILIPILLLHLKCLNNFLRALYKKLIW